MCRLTIKVSTSCYNDSWEETSFAAVTKKESFCPDAVCVYVSGALLNSFD